MNLPVTVTMTVGGTSVEYEDTWNGGVYVGIADFDSSDPYLEIYLVSYGTDVSAYVVLYRYAGFEIYQYLQFQMLDISFFYDTQGYIYYIGEYQGYYDVSLFIDYNTGDIYTID